MLPSPHDVLDQVTPALSAALGEFLKRHPATRVSKNLRNLLLECLQSEEAFESPNVRAAIFDLEGLFKFLDVAEKEWTETIE